MKKLILLFYLFLAIPTAFGDVFQTDIKIIIQNDTLNIQGENTNFLYINLTNPLTQNITLSIIRTGAFNVSVDTLLNVTNVLSNLTKAQYDMIAAQDIRDAYQRIIGQKDSLNEREKITNQIVSNITSWAESEVKYQGCESQRTVMFTMDQKKQAEIDAEKKGADGKSPNVYFLFVAILVYGLFYLQHIKPKKVKMPGTKEFSEYERKEDMFKRW